MSGVPDLQSEINRKAFETISWLTLAVTQKKITPAQFSTGIDALFMAVSGLVTDKDFIVMITEAQRLCDNEKGSSIQPEEIIEKAEPAVW